MKKLFLFSVLLAGVCSGLVAQNDSDTLYRLRQRIQAPISKIEVSGDVMLNVLPANNVSEIQIESSRDFLKDSLMLKYGHYTSELSLKGGVLSIRKSTKSATQTYTLYLSDSRVRMEVMGNAAVYVAAGAVSHFEQIRGNDLSEVVLNGSHDAVPSARQMVDVCRDTVRTSYLQLIIGDMAKVQLKGAASIGKLVVYQEDRSRFAIEDIVLENRQEDGLQRYIGCPLTMEVLDMKLSDFSEAYVSLPLTVGNHRLSLEDGSVYRLNVDAYHADSLFVSLHDRALIVQGRDTAFANSHVLFQDFWNDLYKHIPALDSIAKYKKDTTLSKEEREARLALFMNKPISVNLSSDSVPNNLSTMESLLMKKNKWSDVFSYEGDGFSVYSGDGEQFQQVDTLIVKENDDLSGLTEVFDSLGVYLKDAVHSLSEKRKNAHYWYGDWALYWGFMGSQYDMNLLSDALYFPNTPYDMHISFSALSLEYQKKYWINSRNRIGLGLAVSWDNYRYIAPDSLSVGLTAQRLTPADFTKGKTVVRYVSVPLSYTYGERKSFNIGLEILPGYMYRTTEKLVWENHGKKQVQKTRNYTDVMPYKLDLRLTLGWKWGSIYFQPSLLPVFKDGDSWDVVPMRVGLRLL